MFEIAVSAAMGLACAYVVISFTSKRVPTSGSAALAAAYAATLVVLAGINLESGFIEQKFASEFAFDIYQGEESLRVNSTFRVQYLINYLQFSLTDAWWAATGTNIAITASFLMYLWDRSRFAALAMFAPAVVNFSLFALRDHIIGGLFFILAMSIGAGTKALWRTTPAAIALFITRPEAIVIYVASVVRERGHTLRGAMSKIAYRPVMAAAAIVGLLVAPVLIGGSVLTDIRSVPRVFEDFFQRRAERSTTFGGDGSNILGGRLAGMPFPIRFAIQLLTFFVLPLPFEVRSFALALAFADTIFFIYLTRRFMRLAPRSTKALFIFYAIATSLFVDNYGNLFRLRMPAYFILAAGLLQYDLKRRRASADDSATPERRLPSPQSVRA